MIADLPRPRVAVVRFPGSNDDRDAVHALGLLGADASLVWHADAELPDVDALGRMCEQLLTNPLIESYALELDGVPVEPATAGATRQTSGSDAL